FVAAVPRADHQIVLDGPATRPDLLCHKGVARELAALLGGAVKLPPIPGAGSAATAAEGGVPAGRSRAPSTRGGGSARAAEPGVAAGPSGRATPGIGDGAEGRLEVRAGATRSSTAAMRRAPVALRPA